MRIFRASTHIVEGTVQLRLNNRLLDVDSDVCEETISKGEYILEWFAEGQAFATFGITISSPSAAEFQLTRKLDASGRDFGGFRFSV